MKLQVNFKVAAKTSTCTDLFDFIASPTETVAALKERLASAQRVAFPDQDLVFDGGVLADGLTLAECGVKESSSVDFIVKVSEASLVNQLMQLLLTCALSCDELGLLYCYKYGESVTQALKTLGEDCNLEDFLKKQKVFRVEDGRAMVVKEKALQSVSMNGEADCIVEEGSEQESEGNAAQQKQEKAMADAAIVIQSTIRASKARREVNIKLGEQKAAQKAKDTHDNTAVTQLQKEFALADRMSQVFQEEALVFRDSRKAFQDALEELEAEESRRYKPNLVFRESRQAFQDAIEDLEVAESRRFLANEGFKKMVFRETHLAFHLALEEIEGSLQ